MEIKKYQDKYKNQVISLILYLQNFDNKVDLSLEEQPDMNNITHYYIQNKGGFWIATDDNDDVIGTIGLMNKHPYGILKKFFVNPQFRGSKNGISGQLFEKLLAHARKCGLNAIFLDTPAACVRAHSFYYKKGFEKISKEELPIQYDYPERNSDLFMLKLK